MAKKIETEATTESPYVIENTPKQPWVKTKRGKLVTAIVGGVVVLGATFAAGVKVGEHGGFDGVQSRLGFGDDRHNFGGPDDHGFLPGGQNGQFQAPNGQLPVQPGTGSNGGTSNGQSGTSTNP